MQTIYAALANRPNLLARVEALVDVASQPLTEVSVRAVFDAETGDEGDTDSLPLDLTPVDMGAPLGHGLYARVAVNGYSELRRLGDYDGTCGRTLQYALDDALLVARALDLPLDDGTQQALDNAPCILCGGTGYSVLVAQPTSDDTCPDCMGSGYHLY